MADISILRRCLEEGVDYSLLCVGGNGFEAPLRIIRDYAKNTIKLDF